ncbi:MAG: PTS sugar transporter subunit IIA [Ruminococcaceae bacterium]|nr:PTS sugar transporter subunit IIA [Oscillospiraceae bacterium]
MNEKNLDKLINAASEKLGTSPDRLKRSLENGDIKGLSSSLSRSDKEKLREVMANKELMEKLRKASSPDDIMRLLMNK